ncbi:hypothetical protein ACHAWF_012801 [Thalassiosira exigua]
MEVETREAEIKLMVKDKEVRQLKEKVEREAWVVIMQPKSFEDYKEKDLVPLLTWYDIQRKEWGDKPKKLWLWKDIVEKGTQLPSYEKWTEADDEKLEDLKKMDINIKNTALGRLQSFEKRKLDAAVDSMTQDERDTLRRKLDGLDKSNNN